MLEPIYYLCVDGACVAELSDPQWLDMFWWEYCVTPVSESGASAIRDHLVWENVNFTIVDRSNCEPNPKTFSGGYEEFCNGDTNRLSFRSLPPPDSTQKQPVRPKL